MYIAAGSDIGFSRSNAENVVSADDAGQLMQTEAVRANEAGSVRVIHHDQRAVAIGQIADLLQLRDRTVHGKHAVRGDHAHARTLRVLQRLLELVHVVVGVPQAARLAQANAVDDAGVVDGTAHDGVR